MVILVVDRDEIRLHVVQQCFSCYQEDLQMVEFCMELEFLCVSRRVLAFFFCSCWCAPYRGVRLAGGVLFPVS